MPKIHPRRGSLGFSPFAFAGRIGTSVKKVLQMMDAGEITYVVLGGEKDGMKRIPDPELPRILKLFGKLPPPEPESKSLPPSPKRLATFRKPRGPPSVSSSTRRAAPE